MLSLEDVIRGFASRGPTGPGSPNSVPTVPINGPWQYAGPSQPMTPLQDAMANGFGGYTGEQIQKLYADAGVPSPQQNFNARGGIGNSPYGPPSGVAPSSGHTTTGATATGSMADIGPTSPGGSLSAGGPMTFEQALATAQKMLQEAGVGRGAGAALDAALGNAQRTAGQASNDARNTGKRTQSDDAILYGRLGNFIKGLAAGSAAESNTDRKGVANEYAGLINTNTKNAQQGMGDVNTELARLGITGANANANAANDLAYVTKAAQNDKAGTLGNMRAADAANQGYFKDLRGNAAVQGTGLIAHSKQAVQDALSQIQTALQNQTASIGAQRGALGDSTASQALQMAMQILQQNAAPKGLNDLQNSQAALNLEKVKQMEHDLATGTTGGKTPSGYAAASQYLQSNADPAHLATLANLLATAESGGAGNKSASNHYKFDAGDPNMLRAINQSISSRSQQGYGAPDLNTLMNAILIALGKY